MHPAPPATAAAVALLLRLELRRRTDALRHPRAGAWAAALLPPLLAIAAAWAAAPSVRPDPADGQGRILLGFLGAAVPALFAYPLLFRPDDDGFLRRLGIAPRALYAVRALRLAAATLAGVALALVPFVATGEGLAAPLALALAGGAAGWGVSLWTHAGAAEALSAERRRTTPLDAAIGQFDRELVRVAPVVRAPILPALAGAVAARFATAGEGDAWRMALVVALSLAFALGAAERFARALPRFAARAQEMAFAPAPGVGETGLAVGRGIAALLPRRIGAVRARDAAVVERRYRWASRTGWAVAVAGVLVLARAGDRAEARQLVALAGAVAIAAQAAALLALGRTERGRRAWMDRAAGIGPAARVFGRGAAGLGPALVVSLPLGVTWALATPDGSALPWLLGAAGTAIAAAAASVAMGGR